MIKTATLKLLAACVCPVVGTGVMVKTVPPIKKAVHRMTAPPKLPYELAERAPIAPVPCIPVGGSAIGGGGITFGGSISGPGSSIFPPGGPGVPGTPIVTPGGPNPGGPGTPPSAVPEPDAWATMILGFAIVGYSMRRRNVKVQFDA